MTHCVRLSRSRRVGSDRERVALTCGLEIHGQQKGLPCCSSFQSPESQGPKLEKDLLPSPRIPSLSGFWKELQPIEMHLRQVYLEVTPPPKFDDIIHAATRRE